MTTIYFRLFMVQAVVQRAGTMGSQQHSMLMHLFSGYVGKRDSENCRLDMPDVSSGASHIAPG